MEDVQVVAMLVRRCIAGDAAAWEEIVQTYQPAYLQHLLPLRGIGRRRPGPDPGSLHQDVPHAFEL